MAGVSNDGGVTMSDQEIRQPIRRVEQPVSSKIGISANTG
jgi:hypothetical protein